MEGVGTVPIRATVHIFDAVYLRTVGTGMIRRHYWLPHGIIFDKAPEVRVQRTKNNPAAGSQRYAGRVFR